MAVNRYRISLLELKDCHLRLTPQELLRVLKAWRKKNEFGNVCSKCETKINFGSKNFALCCDQFYFDDQRPFYSLESIAVPTPGYTFLLPQLKRMIEKAGIETDQDFLIIPDPVYWQMATTLIYEKVLKFVSGQPMTCRTKTVQPPSKTPMFYKQIQEAPLNYGSLDSRSCGKATFIRQAAFGKRCCYSMRGMIVPDATLKANEIRLPDSIVKKFGLKGKWVILNRMPSLQPENFVALRVPPDGPSWPHDCFGIPLEILPSINGDFDGDEVNIYLFFSIFSQAECATILNPEWEMGSFVMGMKLSPSQDELVAYHLFYDEIDFLPYKNPDLKKTLRVIYEIYGSKRAFKAFDDMREFQLEKFENHYCFALTLEEMKWLVKTIANGGDISRGRGCLVVQVLAKAKGTFEHLYQMFGEIGAQGNDFVKSSFWSGLTPFEAVAHAKASHVALWQTAKIWQPGYGHNKVIFNVQGLKQDYLGRLIDGESRVVEQDVLYAVHHTDVMSEETFDHILDQVLVKRNFELAKID